MPGAASSPNPGDPRRSQALIYVLEISKAATIMGLQKDLEEAAATLRRYNATNISLAAGCEMFVRNMARIPDDRDFGEFKHRIIRSAKEYAARCERAREDIAELGSRFVEDGATILTHGHSRCVLKLLRKAKDQGRRFSVIVTEGRPDGSGITMAKELKAGPSALLAAARWAGSAPPCPGLLCPTSGLRPLPCRPWMSPCPSCWTAVPPMSWRGCSSSWSGQKGSLRTGVRAAVLRRAIIWW